MNITINIPENSVDNAVVQGKKITVYFPVQETTIVTVLEKGVLFGIQGAQGIQGIQGAQGVQGIQGIPGIGIAAGGSIGQVLVKNSATDYITGWLTLDKTAVGLSNVDNTSDANKPISTATQTSLNGKQALSTNLTSISALTFASTSFVKMTAAGTFALDTNTYLTAESDTLASVTGRGNVTTNAITVGNLTTNGTTQGFIFQDTVGNSIYYSIYPKLTPSATNFLVRSDGSTLVLNSPLSTGFISFRVGNNSMAQFMPTTGNLILQNGGTFTDSGFRLDVNGTARIQNQLTTTGSITAASAIARGVYMNQTLVASANGDTLVGLDITTTFTNGAFTGLSNIGIRTNAAISAPFYLSPSNAPFRLSSSNIDQPIRFYLNLTSLEVGRFHSTTGNLTLQNGGTFTDAGYRLDVNGTARISGATTITPDAVTGTLATSSLDISQTWNTTGQPIALKVNITDTASANLSDLISLQVGGVARFRVLKSGFFTHNVGGEIGGNLVVGGSSINASSIFEARSLTQGFLPPRMTTTQKNAISSPASGLIVYDTTLGKLCLRGASAWETITSA